MFAVTVLGNNSALPMHDRHPTAQVVTYKEQLFLIDCGEGTQMQMNAFKIRRSRINHIFISHLHGDHYFGLFGLLNSYGLNGRREPLHIYAPAALEPLLKLSFDVADVDLPYVLHFHAIQQGSVLLDDENLTVTAFPVTHRIECWGFLFREKPRPRKVIPEKAREAGIPGAFFPQLKSGSDYTHKNGHITRNEEVTEPGPAARSYAFCADTLYEPQKIGEVVKNCTMIYHEATYLEDQQEKAAARYHSTAAQAARIASNAGAKRLLIGHFSSRYTDLQPFLEESRSIFPTTDLAIEGTTYLVGK
jgi:ribonuclease Z